MSDCESDSVELYRGYFDTFCEQITRVYEGRPELESAYFNEHEEEQYELLTQPILNAISDFLKIPWRYFTTELMFPEICRDLIKRLSVIGQDVQPMFGDSELDFMWLLFLTENYSKLRRVHSASGPFKEDLIVFVDGKGNIFDHGIHFLDLKHYRGIQVLDGDADILVGVAKKRGFSRNELERGRPFVVGGKLLRNDKRFKWSWYSQL